MFSHRRTVMTGFSIKEDKTLCECYYHTELSSGFKIIIVPKNTPTTFALVSCDFGGGDIEYEKGGKRFTLPQGTAHFLEHKMFENADGSDAFLEFDAFGGNANAYTSFENTCYYFSCTDNFFDNLNILLKSVSSAHFTKKSVEKEKKIIAREITMYEDSPQTIVNRNLYAALYHNHPIIHPISGTVKTISKIDKETLFRAFDDFYVPSNMTLCICGNVDMEKTAEMCERYFGTAKENRPKTLYRDEPTGVKAEFTEKTAAVASGIYSIGIKCAPLEANSISAQRKATAMRLAISLIFGRASDFFCKNYESGIINERFYAAFQTSRNAAYALISGSGSNAQEVKVLVVDEINRVKREFFDKTQILREKKAAFAECLTLFDMGEDIVSAMAANARLDFDEYDCIDILRSITDNDIKDALALIDTENISLSIVKKGN